MNVSFTYYFYLFSSKMRRSCQPSFVFFRTLSLLPEGEGEIQTPVHLASAGRWGICLTLSTCRRLTADPPASAPRGRSVHIRYRGLRGGKPSRPSLRPDCPQRRGCMVSAKGWRGTGGGRQRRRRRERQTGTEAARGAHLCWHLPCRPQVPSALHKLESGLDMPTASLFIGCQG